jgi:hypothetical protein
MLKNLQNTKVMGFFNQITKKVKRKKTPLKNACFLLINVLTGRFLINRALVIRT